MINAIKIGLKDMNRIIKLILFVVVITIFVTSGIWIEMYRFKDCKKVGHTALYCILNLGK